MGLSRFLVLIGLLFFSFSAWSQVRLIQWTDAHSSIQTISKQVLAMDYVGQDFLRINPRGEVIIYIIGDFTSINPLNNEEGGWSSFEALRLLRQRGYTVLFTPGNHDAFDWTVKIDGAQLFLKQMQRIKSWGVKVLANNLRKKTKAFKAVTTNSYELKTLHKKTHIVGLTLPILMSKSNLNEWTAKTLFEEIEPYRKTFRRLFSTLSKKNVESVIFGVHQGHEKLKRQLPIMKSVMEKRGLDIQIPLVLGAHDHLVASYTYGGTHFSNSGSYGAFNIVDITADGHVQSASLQHIPMTMEQVRSIRPELFQMGHLYLNDISFADVEKTPWLRRYHRSIQKQIQDVELRLNRVLTNLVEPLSEHKMHMKAGQTEIGGLLAESMVRWARVTFSLAPHVPVIAMTNSSSYRREEGLPAGPLVERTVREFYPFHTEATIYQLYGREIKNMYFSLRKFYSAGGNDLYSPQVNFDIQEKDEELQMKISPDIWAPIADNQLYYVVFDGWLSEHRFGQGYRIPEWNEILADKQPMAKESYQDLLVRLFPRIVEAHQKGQSLNPVSASHQLCHSLFL